MMILTGIQKGLKTIDIHLICTSARIDPSIYIYIYILVKSKYEQKITGIYDFW